MRATLPGTLAAVIKPSADPTLADRFRAHARALVDSGRSPLYAELMAAAANDLDQGGVVARLFEGLPVPRGSVPQLRLMAALHELVLARSVPELARFYPSAGGENPPQQAWPRARAALNDHFDWIRQRLPRTVQTNEVGRSTVLYAVLLWLADRSERRLRLLEIGASAGLNLHADRYAYDVGEATLGEPSSAVRFQEPWRPGPQIDLAAARDRLRISHRAGCDLAPLDPSLPDDRRRLQSYIWPDEPERLQRLQAALAIAARNRVPIARSSASEWLAAELERRRVGELTVVWHSVVRQYVPGEEWAAVIGCLRAATAARPDRPIVRVAMEPRRDHVVNFAVSLHAEPDGPGQILARCGDHGPPVVWQPPAATAG
ncbi:MAG TPA: DUF2332 domain-containing protein [Solirubrobacteraceae bacterium]|jgi:hypothetical protein|nr:DUF2332 domain-containing protein [Solirubrobacteraceae bacterium]